MKSSLFFVLSLLLFSPLTTFAVESPFGLGTKYNPIYIQQGFQQKIPLEGNPIEVDPVQRWKYDLQQKYPQPSHQNTGTNLNDYLLQQQLGQLLHSQQQLTLDQRCKNKYGINAYAANGTCYYCPTGYHWTADMKCAPNTSTAGVETQVQNLLNDIAEMNVPVASVSGSANGGTLITASSPAPTHQASISPKVAENEELTDIEKMANWHKHYGEVAEAGASTNSSHKTSPSALSLFGLLPLLLGLLGIKGWFT